MGYTEPKVLSVRQLLKAKASEIEYRDLSDGQAGKFADISGDVLLQGRLCSTTTHCISTEEMVSYGEQATIARHREAIARELWEEAYGQVLGKIQAEVYGVRMRLVLLFDAAFGTDTFMMKQKNEVLQMLEKLVEDLNPNLPGDDDADNERDESNH